MFFLQTPSLYAALLVLLGLFLFNWIIALCGLIIFALFGKWVSATLSGLLLDVAYGQPITFLHGLFLPFTVFSLFLILMRLVVFPYIRPRSLEHM